MKKLLQCFLLFVATTSVVAGANKLPDNPIDKIVAIVNDRVITQSEIDKQLLAIKQQIAKTTTPLPPDEVLQKQVLDHLVDINLQMQIAERNNITINEEQLDQAVKKVAKRNKMKVSELRQEIKKQGMSFSQYRENVRKEMIISNLQQKVFTDKIQLSEDEINKYMKQRLHAVEQNRDYHVKNILISLNDEPTSDEILEMKKKAKELIVKIKNGADFGQIAIAESSDPGALHGGDLGWRKLAELPDIFSKELQHMKSGDVGGPIRTSNGFYVIKLVGVKGGPQKHYTQFIHAKQILLGSHTKAKLVRDQLIAGESFAKLAKRYSLEKHTAKKGGDLGWIHYSQLVPEVRKVAKELKTKHISPPIKSKYGWYLVEVFGHKKVDDTQKVVKMQVRNFLYRRKFEEHAQTWLQELRAKAYIKYVS